MSESTTTKCSRCGGTEALHLVTAGVYPGAGARGRVLVYCAPCRRPGDGTPPHDVSIPLELVTPELFVKLYRRGYTASDPDFAAQLVFGECDPRLVKKAEKILRDRPR